MTGNISLNCETYIHLKILETNDLRRFEFFTAFY